jgi:glycosyltransferase involved in cell wall biosynthesis
VIEAMAWGIPVVAWNYAGTTVTVSDGESGYLAEPYKVKSYAEGILRLLTNPRLRARMGKAARERVEKLFSWERHVSILEGAIWQALGEPLEVSGRMEVPVASTIPDPQMIEVEIES